MIMLPKFYQKCASYLLTPTQYKMLQILVLLLQFHKTVTSREASNGWYLLTNLSSLKMALQAFKQQSSIEAMFKDCKTGGTALLRAPDLKQVPCGYNLEASHTTNKRLLSLILLIAIAYSCAVLSGRRSRSMGVQKYIRRLNELKRTCRRHSAFWVGLYGQLWVGAFVRSGQI